MCTGLASLRRATSHSVIRHKLAIDAGSAESQMPMSFKPQGRGGFEAVERFSAYRTLYFAGSIAAVPMDPH